MVDEPLGTLPRGAAAEAADPGQGLVAMVGPVVQAAADRRADALHGPVAQVAADDVEADRQRQVVPPAPLRPQVDDAMQAQPRVVQQLLVDHHAGVQLPGQRRASPIWSNGISTGDRLGAQPAQQEPAGRRNAAHADAPAAQVLHVAVAPADQHRTVAAADAGAHAQDRVAVGDLRIEDRGNGRHVVACRRAPPRLSTLIGSRLELAAGSRAAAPGRFPGRSSRRRRRCRACRRSSAFRPCIAPCGPPPCRTQIRSRPQLATLCQPECRLRRPACRGPRIRQSVRPPPERPAPPADWRAIRSASSRSTTPTSRQLSSRRWNSTRPAAAALAAARRPGWPASRSVRPVHDVEPHAVAEREVIQRLPRAVGDFHDHAEQRVAVARQVDRPREGGPEVVERLGRQAHAAVVDAVDRLALPVGHAAGQGGQGRRRGEQDADLLALAARRAPGR